jgi:hypothetical protein
MKTIIAGHQALVALFAGFLWLLGKRMPNEIEIHFEIDRRRNKIKVLIALSRGGRNPACFDQINK